MKILVMSDSHGAEEKITEAIKTHPDAKAIIFLGDGERDFEEALAECDIFPYGSHVKDIYDVRGNCDLYSNLAETLTGLFEEKRVLISHGYLQNVKYGLSDLLQEAKEKKCQAALFGHTHKRHLSKKDGIVLFNPGSIRGGSYGVIELKEKEEDLFSWCEL